jgi:hypothetical protein
VRGEGHTGDSALCCEKWRRLAGGHEVRATGALAAERHAFNQGPFGSVPSDTCDMFVELLRSLPALRTAAVAR